MKQYRKKNYQICLMKILDMLEKDIKIILFLNEIQHDNLKGKKIFFQLLIKK